MAAIATMAGTTLANAQTNFFEKTIDELTENFITLGVQSETTFSSGSDDNSTALGAAIGLEAPNITAKSYAGDLSANGGFTFDVIDSDMVNAGISIGARGTFDADGGVFEDGFDAKNGVLGMTPTLGGSVWIGDGQLGVLIESENGFGGQDDGWQGSTTLAYNIVDDVPNPFSRRHSGFSELLVGASLTAMDDTYAQSQWTGGSATSAPEAGLESWALGAKAAFDLGSGLRLSTPLGFRQYLGSAADYHGNDGGFDVSLGLSLGYRFK